MVYEDGIMRVKIDEMNSERFGISDIKVGVEEQNLLPKNIINISKCNESNIAFEYTSEDGSDHYSYKVQYSPFRIELRVNEILTTIVNHHDSLFFENSKALIRKEDV
jgi:hypothetical protein